MGEAPGENTDCLWRHFITLQAANHVTDKRHCCDGIGSAMSIYLGAVTVAEVPSSTQIILAMLSYVSAASQLRPKISGGGCGVQDANMTPSSAPRVASMEYRLYCLDGKDHIVSARNFLALDDLTALGEAEASSKVNAVELWQGARRVARVKLGNAPLDSSDRMAL